MEHGVVPALLPEAPHIFRGGLPPSIAELPPDAAMYRSNVSTACFFMPLQR